MNRPKPIAGTPWPASSVRPRSLTDLKDNPRNARRHSDAQIEQLAASMLEFGVTTPVLVDEGGTILYGHARVAAARLLLSRGEGAFASLPTVEAVGWSEAQKRAYLIADNQIAIASTWDEDRLRIELADLKLEGFNLDLMGFGATDLSSLLAAPQSAEERASRTIKPPGKARAKAGQVVGAGEPPCGLRRCRRRQADRAARRGASRACPAIHLTAVSRSAKVHVG